MMPKKQPEEPSHAGEVPTSDLQIRFGTNLRAFRKHAGLTQGGLAAISGIDQAEISKIELGKVNLTLARMAILAQVVHHDVSHLLAKNPKPPPKK